MESLLSPLLPYLQLLVPVLVMLVVAATKRWIAPALDRLEPRAQQAVVGAAAAVLTTVLQLYGLGLPEGVDVFSPEGVQFFLYAALGALGAHSVVRPKSSRTPWRP